MIWLCYKHAANQTHIWDDTDTAGPDQITRAMITRATDCTALLFCLVQ